MSSTDLISASTSLTASGSGSVANGCVEPPGRVMIALAQARLGVGLKRVGVFVLVGGWPGSGKTTLAVALAEQLTLPLLAKDEIKEALSDGLGSPETVPQSQCLGRAAVLAMLRVAARCPGVVMDSTWYDYSRPLVANLPGRLVEVQCVVSRELARSRYYARAATRHQGHLDMARGEDELWGEPPRLLGLGALINVDTSGAVDVPGLAREIMSDRLAD